MTGTSTALQRGDDVPGIQLEILGISGGTGSGGAFQVGDQIALDFNVTKSDGTAWDLGDFTFGFAMVSGPTSNYQRVIPQVDDLLTAAVENGDGSFRYQFTSPIPATYPEPWNDTTAFGAGDGELTGEDLLEGTYTAALTFAWEYTVDDRPYRDAANATVSFTIGADSIEPREVVAQANCTECHDQLQAHGSIYRHVDLCLMCHTSGAEDRNVATVAGGTPGVSIDFRVMIHKLHNAAHLPSVLGVGTLANGARDYTVPPRDYQLVGYGDRIHDYSHAAFPVMPSAYVAFTYDASGANYTGAFGNGPMPRDVGYMSQPLNDRMVEDRIRTGAVACDKCHGDPDGASGPIGAPAQGQLAVTNPTRRACGACHDDVDWSRQYVANGLTMPPQANDSDCATCHDALSGRLSTDVAHLHPYSDPAFNSGVRLAISSVSGGTGPGGNHVVGDPIGVTFSVKDDAGADRELEKLTRFQMIVSGPSENPQWMLPNVNVLDFSFRKSSPFTGNGTISKPVVTAGGVAQTIGVVFTNATTFDVVASAGPTLSGQSIGASSGAFVDVSHQGVSFRLTQGSTPFAANDRFYFEALPKSASYTMFVPRDLSFERLGVATGAAQSLNFGNTPALWGRQVVFERTALVGASIPLGDSAPAFGRFVTCDATAVALAVGDRVVIDGGSAFEEYLQVSRVQTVDDESGQDLGVADRIWFTTALRYAHAAGTSTLQECTLSSKREGSAYTIATSGATSISLVAGQFTNGNPVIASYRTFGRFGYFDAPGEPRLLVYPAVATGDSDDLDATWGDWKGQSLVDGTYRVGMWANVDFSVDPSRQVVTTEAFNNLNSDNTTYRMMALPATADFLFGVATTIERRSVIANGESCNKCHGDLAAHGFGRRGFDTCMLCHATPGAEDGSKYSFPTWYVGPTPRVTMDFRTLLHKVHMGKELTNGASYVVNGIFLGTPYPVRYDEIGFPSQPGGVLDCAACHGEGNDTWQRPADRDHPSTLVPRVREWRAVCTACHDSAEASAHADVQTSAEGEESCAVCHGEGKEWSVQLMHKRY